MIQVYNTMPDFFSPQVEVAAIYVNVIDKILLLQCAKHKEERWAWRVPAGKLEPKETPLHAAQRELLEETGIRIKQDDVFQSLGALYIQKTQCAYVYHLFSLQYLIAPSIALSSEHAAYTWVSRIEAVHLPLMEGAIQALDAYYSRLELRKK